MLWRSDHDPAETIHDRKPSPLGVIAMRRTERLTSTADKIVALLVALSALLLAGGFQRVLRLHEPTAQHPTTPRGEPFP